MEVPPLRVTDRFSRLLLFSFVPFTCIIVRIGMSVQDRPTHPWPWRHMEGRSHGSSIADSNELDKLPCKHCLRKRWSYDFSKIIILWHQWINFLDPPGVPSKTVDPLDGLICNIHVRCPLELLVFDSWLDAMVVFPCPDDETIEEDHDVLTRSWLIPLKKRSWLIQCKFLLLL